MTTSLPSRALPGYEDVRKEEKKEKKRKGREEKDIQVCGC